MARLTKDETAQAQALRAVLEEGDACPVCAGYFVHRRTPPLTGRQAEIVNWWADWRERTGRWPSLLEAAAHFGVHRSAIRSVLLAARRKGYMAQPPVSGKRGWSVLVRPASPRTSDPQGAGSPLEIPAASEVPSASEPQEPSSAPAPG